MKAAIAAGKVSRTDTPSAAPLLELRLYVAGQTVKSLAAIANLRRICAEQVDTRCEVEVIDLIETPEMGRCDQIVAIPTLVRKQPPPVRKIIGDLSNIERVLTSLGLHPPRKEA